MTPFRWRYPILEADFPQDFDLHLDGRGLLLIPAFFCVRYPVKLFDPALPPTAYADLVRAVKAQSPLQTQYEGLCW